MILEGRLTDTASRWRPKRRSGHQTVVLSAYWLGSAGLVVEDRRRANEEGRVERPFPFVYFSASTGLDCRLGVSGGELAFRRYSIGSRLSG